MSININSIRGKKLELLAFLDFHQPQIVAIQETTRMMFIKHYAPNRCLCIKVAKLITGLRIADMSQLQNCSVMCTKNGSYCENEKKREKKSGGRGDVYKEWKLL